ncbi:zinc finger CCHC domain-containing protein 17-like [Suncus etruscus]|uniref:zinc finger CCHC domain-containing protein 17-like n=1 Tax=Suncus etruscus TaxID=109475 RepID=UPI00210FC664|nr:zinc finger CCHC domain-containing protein 17-like [Suncus etruscus]
MYAVKSSEIVNVGDKIRVKFIIQEMKNDRIKVCLSMKLVNQDFGKDFDSNNVIIEQKERRSWSFQDYTARITLKAVLYTTCKKCGCKGHFAKDCFMQPGESKYYVIPYEEEKSKAKSEFEKPDPTMNSRKRMKEKKKKRQTEKSSDFDSPNS